MFEPEVFRKQMYCIEESTCDIVGSLRRPPQWFGAPEIVPPLPPLVAPLRTFSLYCVKRSKSEPVAMLPQVWKPVVSASVSSVPECQTTLMFALSRTIKTRGLLEYIYVGLKYAWIVKIYFWHLSEYWVPNYICCVEFS